MDAFLKALDKTSFSQEGEQLFFVYLRKGVVDIVETLNVGDRQNRCAQPDIFELSKAIETEGFIALAHTHPEGSEFSKSDLLFAEAWQIPIIVINSKTKSFDFHDPCEFVAKNIPLLGRPQTDLMTNCYTLARDYHYINNGKTLHKIGRKYEWKIEDIQEPLMDKFYGLMEWEVGDILIFGSKGMFSHCGVYLGDSKMLHQTNLKESCIEDVPARLKKKFVCLFRLKK